MRTNDAASSAALHAAIDALADQDPTLLPVGSVRRDVRELLSATNRLHAELARRVAAFDAENAAQRDGYRTTKAWLRAYGRLSPTASTRLVQAARLLRELPRLADAAGRGRISAEHVHRADRLATRVGIATARTVDGPLAELGSWIDPTAFGRACDRVRSADADGGVLVQAPPAVDGPSAHQRATDLIRSARRAMRQQRSARAGDPPRIGITQKPESMITPEDLATPPEDLPAAKDSPSHGEGLADRGRSGWRGGPGGVGAQLGRRPPRRPGTSRPSPSGPPATAGASGGPAPGPNVSGSRAGGRLSPGVFAFDATGDPPDRAVTRSQPTRNESTVTPLRTDGVGRPPAWHTSQTRHPSSGESPSWFGGIADEVGRRLACDADVWQVVLDPATHQPLGLGRAHSLVPPSIRRELQLRDRGCRFRRCHAHVSETVVHHLRAWTEGGVTESHNLILLCRRHHALVHEGGWSISRERGTGTIVVLRPDDHPYWTFELPDG